MLNLTPRRWKASAKVEQNPITTKHTTNFFLRKNENNFRDGKVWHAEMAESKEEYPKMEQEKLREKWEKQGFEAHWSGLRAFWSRQKKALPREKK